MATTSGNTVVEIVYCANKATTTGREPRDLPLACEQELADRIEAFRAAEGDPTSITTFVTKNPQGDDVYGAILVVLNTPP